MRKGKRDEGEGKKGKGAVLKSHRKAVRGKVKSEGKKIMFKISRGKASHVTRRRKR